MKKIKGCKQHTPQEWADFTGLAIGHAKASPNQLKKFQIMDFVPSLSMEKYPHFLSYSDSAYTEVGRYLGASLFDCSEVDWSKKKFGFRKGLSLKRFNPSSGRKFGCPKKKPSCATEKNAISGGRAKRQP